MKVSKAVVITLAVLLTITGFVFVYTQFVGNPFSVNVVVDPDGSRDPLGTDVFFYQHGGQLKVNIKFYWSYDDSAITTNRPTIYIYHADKESLFGSMSSSVDNVTGDMWIADEGILYCVMDWGTGTTYFLHEDRIATDNAYISGDRPTRWDYDEDGTDEYLYKLDVTKLSKISAGESQKEITFNGYAWKAESAPAITSISNVTTMSYTAYEYYVAEAYISGWDGEGYAIKINRLKVTLPDAGNATVSDDGNVKLQYVSLVYGDGKTFRWTGYDWDQAGKEYVMDLGMSSSEQTQEFDGKLVMYERGTGSTFAKVNIKIQAKMTAINVVWLPTIKLYYINPAGTIASTTLTVKFDSYA